MLPIIAMGFSFLIVLGLLYPVHLDYSWHCLPPQIRSEMFSLNAFEGNVIRMTQDVVDVVVDHPSFERLMARYYLGRALFSCENIAFAIPEETEDFSRAIKLDPRYARAYLYHGVGLLNMNRAFGRHPIDADTAESRIIADLSAAIKLDPKGIRVANAYDILCTEYECGLYQHQKVIEICSLAISNLPLSSASGFYHGRAWAYGKLGQYDQEKEDYRVSKELQSKFALADQIETFAGELEPIGWLLLLFSPFGFWISWRINIWAAKKT
jgi:tetratricopeptide (TPR) repeat protein